MKNDTAYSQSSCNFKGLSYARPGYLTYLRILTMNRHIQKCSVQSISAPVTLQRLIKTNPFFYFCFIRVNLWQEKIIIFKPGVILLRQFQRLFYMFHIRYQINVLQFHFTPSVLFQSVNLVNKCSVFLTL